MSDELLNMEALYPFPEGERKRLNARSWILRHAKKGGVGAEIGVFRGHFSEIIADIVRPRRYFLFDPWTRLGEFFDFKGPYTNDGRLPTALALREAQLRVGRFPEVSAKFIEGFFLDELAALDEPLDWAYLDASHQFEPTLAELRAISKRVKSDGVILGDDWHSNPSHKHHGVFRAVQTFVRESDFRIVAAGPGAQFCLRRFENKFENASKVGWIGGPTLTRNMPKAASIPSLNFRSVNIVTYGRSGSTLLQGLLNQIPGCVVRGENHNFCFGLFNSYVALCRTKEVYGGPESGMFSKPFFGAKELNPEKYVAQVGAVIRDQLLPEGASEETAVGFKEIRYLPSMIDEANAGILREYLSFLNIAIGPAAFVFLRRDLQEVVASAWWKERDQKEIRCEFERFEESMGGIAAEWSNVFEINYNDIVTKSDVLKQLFDFLGAPYNDEAVDRVLGVRHSYDNKPETLARTSNLHVVRSTSAHIAEFSLDFIPLRMVPGGALELNGVAVLAEGADTGWELAAGSGSDVYEVQWGASSPKMRQKFPSSPNSNSARFKVTGRVPDVGGELQMWLVSRSLRERLISIRVLRN